MEWGEYGLKIILIFYIEDIMLIANGEPEVTSTTNILLRYMCAREWKLNAEKVQWFAKSVKFLGVHGKRAFLKHEASYSS